MARPESTDRGGNVTPGVVRTSSQHPHTGRRGHPNGAVNHNNPLQVKRQRLDPNTVKELKNEFMQLWKRDINSWFPDLHNRSYVVPPVHFNRPLYKHERISNSPVKILLPVQQLSDLREDEALQRIHNLLSRFFDEESDEPAVIIFELDFDSYLNNGGSSGREKAEKRQKKPNSQRTHSADVSNVLRDNYTSLQSGNSPTNQFTTGSEADLSLFNRPRDLESAFQRGRFDVLIISQKYGIVILEVKAIGDVFSLSENLQSVGAQHQAIRKKLERSLKQLHKEERALQFLLKDLVDPTQLPVTKGLILPNLERRTAMAALMQDRTLVQYFCRSLETDTLEDALQLCIFSDQLPPVGYSLNTDDDIINRLRSDWWEKLSSRPSSGIMPIDLYESIVARFCGSATTQFVTTAHDTRAAVSTLKQAVAETARCFTDLVLTAQQVETVTLNSDPLVYLTGPPGTGKTILLMLKALSLLQEGKTVLVTSLWEGSEAIAKFIHQKVQQDMPAERERIHLVSSRQGKRGFDDILDEIETLLLKQQNHPTKGEPSFTSPGWDVRQKRDTATDVRQKRDTATDQSVESRLLTEDSDLEMDCSPPLISPIASIPRQRFDFDGYESRRITCSPERISFETESQSGELSYRETQKPNLAGRSEHMAMKRKKGKVCLVIDEAPWFLDVFMQKLKALSCKDHVVVWAASSFPTLKPKSFREIVLSLSLRCPPVVVKEMMTGSAYTTFARHTYTSLDAGVLSAMPSPTDGPPVKRICHQGHPKGNDIWNCEECGKAVARFLTRDLLIGTNISGTVGQQKETLRFSDVLISGYLPCLSDVKKDPATSYKTDVVQDSMEGDSRAHCSEASQRHEPGFVRGLQQEGVKPEIIIRGDESSIEKLVSPEKWDRVQMAAPESIMGLERAVVVVIGTTDVRETYPRFVDPWFDVMARCTSQLVIVGEPSLTVQFGNIRIKPD